MRRGALALLAVAAFSQVVPGCGSDSDVVADRLDVAPCNGTEALSPVGTSSAALSAVSSCESLPELLRGALIEQARRRVMAARCQVLSTDCASYDSAPMFGCGATYDDEVAMAAPPADGDGQGAEEYSTTNTQEAGVDEADLVKNDGEYVYVVSGNRLQILDAWPASETELISSVAVEGDPQVLFVEADRAVVYSYDPSHTCYDTYNYDSWYGYGCVPYDTTTLVTVYDITDRTAPVLERQIELEGAYVSSRRIGSAIHTVVAFPGPQIDGLRFYLGGACSYEEAEELEQDVDELITYNTQLIEQATIGNVLPQATDTRYFADGTSETSMDLFGGCDQVLVPPFLSGASFLTVLSFDVGSEAPARVSSVVGEQGVVYGSTESLYVASVDNQGTGLGFETTTIHRFALEAEPARTRYEASGRVGGRVLNQFSMGEHEGHLRVATTTGHLPSPQAFNSVYVLAQRGTELQTVGEIPVIAPTEDIRSARFDGDRGFIVTFKKTDPLFVLDLADPQQPRIAGELHIPGYSTYIHMMDDSHLLTIGYEADDQGDFAWFQGIQLQIFDVADMTSPALVHKHVIGTRGTSSAAATNHLAFNYFAPKDLLAIPMAICEGSSGGGSYGDVMTFNGLMVFDATAESGFSEHGRIDHGLPSYGGCSNWWTDPAAGVQRSIIMDDYVFSIDSDQIIVAHLDTLESPVATIPLASSSTGY